MTGRKPLAWIGVFDGEPDPEFIWWDEAKAHRWLNTRPGVELAPLFLGLTDAEREAIAWLTKGESPFFEEEQRMATLRGLLERTRASDGR